MPIINVTLFEGETADRKRTLMRAITDAVHKEVGMPLESVRVYVHEIDKSNVSIGGTVVADKAQAKS